MDESKLQQQQQLPLPEETPEPVGQQTDSLATSTTDCLMTADGSDAADSQAQVLDVTPRLAGGNNKAVTTPGTGGAKEAVSFNQASSNEEKGLCLEPEAVSPEIISEALVAGQKKIRLLTMLRNQLLKEISEAGGTIAEHKGNKVGADDVYAEWLASAVAAQIGGPAPAPAVVNAPTVVLVMGQKLCSQLRQCVHASDVHKWRPIPIFLQSFRAARTFVKSEPWLWSKGCHFNILVYAGLQVGGHNIRLSFATA